MAQFFVRGDMEPIEAFWYFWVDGKVVQVDMLAKTGWLRHEWVGILMYTPDWAEESPPMNGKIVMTPYSILEPVTGLTGVHPDDVPPEFKIQLLLMGVL